MSGSKDQKPFARSFSHLLKRATQFSVHQYMQGAGRDGLTHRQFTVLAAVDAFDGKSQTELVRATGIDRSTLADLVARLMTQGLLQRRRSKEDARTNSVRLTPVGKKALKAAQSGAEDVDRAMFARFSNAERKMLLDCLATVAAEMDKVESDNGEVKPAGKVRLKRKV